MHTFFINTSGKELENYSDIFEIQHETRRLVSLDCPLDKWEDKDEGYKDCVRKMGELIDSYKDINNDFILILYIDLLSYEEYTSIPVNEHRKRHACLKTLRMLLKHYIRHSLLNEMVECGRAPKEFLLIFEENKAPEDKDETSEDGKRLIRSYVRDFLGIPSDDDIDNIFRACSDNADEQISPEIFCKKSKEFRCSPLGDKLLDTYSDKIDIFIKENLNEKKRHQPVKTAGQLLQNLLDRVMDCHTDDDEEVKSVSFITDRCAEATNKRENARRNLRLCFYISACVKDETIFEKRRMDGDDVLAIKSFPDINWEDVAAELSAKFEIFQKKHKETQGLSKSFSEMKLAPTLYALNNQRFALDEFAERDKTLDVTDAEETEEEKQEEKDDDKEIIRLKGKKAVVVSKVCARSLFTEKEFRPFDYKGDDFDKSILDSKASAEQYIAMAKKIRQLHLDYLKRLKVHVTDSLSNYAGRSAQNEPALLRKRKVSVAEEDFKDSGRDYRYAKPEMFKETRKLETVENISQKAYSSALIDYMEFCAGRSVAVTDVEEQCNWFVTRVCQIEESLRKIRFVAIGLFFVMLVLYIPFAVLQWKEITENALTFAIALCSIAVPLAVLYLIFAIISALQRKKYRKVWKEFKQKSDEILAENALSAEKFDQLLTVYIPTLRWVYEYKLDVEFYADCCKMAKAKINHHSQKLHDRVEVVGNIIEDLEAGAIDRDEAAQRVQNNTNNEINYNVSFCSGQNNMEFYSIIDTCFLDSVYKREDRI